MNCVYFILHTIYLGLLFWVCLEFGWLFYMVQFYTRFFSNINTTTIISELAFSID